MKNVDDIFVLTPMQQLMLLHAVAHPEDDVLVSPVAYAIDAEVDPIAFRAAWQAVLQRHPALRTAMLWDGLDHPVQVVRSEVEFPLESLDLSGLGPSERDARLEALWTKEGGRGFDLTRAPLLRGTLVRLEPGRWRFLLCLHHLVGDRWSEGIVLPDLQAAYRSIEAGDPPPSRPARPYRDYVAWLAARDGQADERFWRETLAGLTAPTRLAERGPQTTGPADTLRRSLGPDLSTGLRATASKARVPLGSLLLGGLGLAAGRRTGRRDVVLGVTASGRPPDLPGVEEIVGSFVNDVPARITLPPDGTVGDWLRELARGQAARTAHDYVSPAAIQAWSPLPPDQPLWDVLVVLNLARAPEPDPVLPLRLERARLDAAHPLTVWITDEDGTLALTVTSRVDRDIAEAFIDACAEALADLAVADVDGPLSRVSLPEADEGGTPTPIEGPLVERDDDEATLEERVTRIWRDVLGLDHVDLDDDFFALGGTSLQAATIFDRVERTTGRTLPLSLLARTASLRGLLEALDRPPPPSSGPLVTLRSPGDGPPVYAVSGMGGGIVELLPLARNLRPGRPVRALQARGYEGEDTPLESIEEIAADYVAALLDDAERGVHLLGVCWGGAVVHAMAAQLTADGRPPLSLSILDPPLLHPGPELPSAPPVEGFISSRVRLYAKEFRELDWPERRRFLLRKGATAWRVLRNRSLPDETRAERARAGVLAANRTAIDRFRPEPLDVRARLFFVEDRPALEPGRDYRRDFAELLSPRPDVVVIPGADSGDALRRHTRAFAMALDAWLREAEADVA